MNDDLTHLIERLAAFAGAAMSARSIERLVRRMLDDWAVFVRMVEPADEP